MVCPTFTDSERIISFSARYTINGLFTGTVVIADPDCEFTISCDLCQPIRLRLPSTTVGVCPECEEFAEDACFTSDPYWIAGVVTSITEAGFLDDVPLVSCEVVSFAEFLSNKPISSEHFANTDLNTVLTRLFFTYTGLHPSWRNIMDIGIAEFDVHGPINGNSTLAELQKLAAAGYSHLFNQVGGVLFVQHWKDHNSSVDWIIPPELIVSVSKNPLSPSRLSVVRVRGAAFPRYQCGEQIFTDSRIGDINGGYESIGGVVRTCGASGIPTPDLTVNFDNLAASREDLLNSIIVADGVDTSQPFEIGEGTLGVTVARQDGEWFDEAAQEYAILIGGKRRPEYEYAGGDFDNIHLRNAFANRAKETHYRWNALSPWPMPLPSFFGGSFGTQSGAYSADQTTMDRIEMEITDPRFSSCGIRDEQIDNVYVPHKEILFGIGVRRFQEMRMEENTYLLEIAYMPCLRINQVVQFDTSNFDNCTRTVTGVIAGIDLNYEAEGPNVTMRLVIWGFDCIGGNSYTSGNLISFDCAGDESATVNPWVATALGIESFANLEDNCGIIYTVGFPSIAQLELTQEFMTPGDTYTISFDYESLGGFTPFTFAYPGGSTPLNGAGSFSIPFVAPAATGTFSWTLQNSFIPTAYRICNPILTKTVTA